MITLNEFVAFVSMEMVHYFCLFMFLPCVWMFCYIAVDSIIVLPCHWFGNLCIGVRTTSSIKVSFVCCLLLPSLADLGGMEECFPNGWSFVTNKVWHERARISYTIRFVICVKNKSEVVFIHFVLHSK